MACSRRWRWRNKKAFELAQAGGRRGKTGADCRALRYEAQSSADECEVDRSSDMDDQRNLILHLCQH